MANLLRISDAASLAMHAMVMLAANPGKEISTRQIASELNASEAHLSKVLQRLAKAGLVTSTRGPKGGFMLQRRGEEVRLLDVYEAIEGPLVRNNCLLGKQICDGKCILGDLLETVDRQIGDYLAGTNLAELTDVYRLASGEMQEAS
jgi:Rrf2 family protein